MDKEYEWFIDFQQLDPTLHVYPKGDELEEFVITIETLAEIIYKQIFIVE